MYSDILRVWTVDGGQAVDTPIIYNLIEGHKFLTPGKIF